MSTIKIHNPCNEITRHFRYYNLFWDQLTHELCKNFNVIENRYFPETHRERSTVYSQAGEIFELYDCEYLVENLDNGEIIALSINDLPDYTLLSNDKGKNIKKLLIAQFSDVALKLHTKNSEMYRENDSRYSPWIYFQALPHELEQYFFKRLYEPPTENVLFFKGDCGSREIIDHFPKDLISNPRILMSEGEYFKSAIKHKIGLSIAGRGEFCYRDVEYMALGIPFIRFQYQNKMAEPLIPNFHYISVPYPTDMPRHNEVPTDRLGQAHHVDMLLDRYYEVINDTEFLQYVSSNARQYYEEYLQYPNNIKHTINLMNINEWI